MNIEIHIEEFHAASRSRKLARMKTIGSRISNPMPGFEKKQPRKNSGVDLISKTNAAHVINRLRTMTIENIEESHLDKEACNYSKKILETKDERGILKKLSMGRNLKQKLAESLSPAPFVCVNNPDTERAVDILMTSTNDSMLNPYYGKNNLLRKALRNHILHILQSICIIKRLKPIPKELLAKKTIYLPKNEASIFNP